MNVQNINSAPEYINKFINHNFTKLIEIYDQGISENGTGVLSFKCSESENKMDVYFMNESQILVNLQKESSFQVEFVDTDDDFDKKCEKLSQFIYNVQQTTPVDFSLMKNQDPRDIILKEVGVIL